MADPSASAITSWRRGRETSGGRGASSPPIATSHVRRTAIDDGRVPLILNTARPQDYFNTSEAGLRFPSTERCPTLLVGIGLLLTFFGLVTALYFTTDAIRMATDLTASHGATHGLSPARRRLQPLRYLHQAKSGNEILAKLRPGDFSACRSRCPGLPRKPTQNPPVRAPSGGRWEERAWKRTSAKAHENLRENVGSQFLSSANWSTRKRWPATPQKPAITKAARLNTSHSRAFAGTGSHHARWKAP
jgi:hypothetical protein